VASQGSFTKAAKAIHVTQPTLSDHVRSLEGRYGVKLFKRQGRGVALTSLGRALLELTRRQFSLEAETEQLLSSSIGMMSGQLRVAADSPFLVLPLLETFSRRHPAIKISMTFGNTETVLADLFELRADIGVVAQRSDDGRLEAIPYREDKLVLIVQRGHPWSQRRSVALAEIESERLIMREPGSLTRSIFEQAMNQHKVEAKTVVQIGSREGVREAVAVGLGVGVMPESEMGNDNRIHPVTVRDASLKVIEYIACLKETRPTPVVKAFFDILKESLEVIEQGRG
jgi:aminoethylphosphonate catabolism LysR family transcriptional regulator